MSSGDLRWTEALVYSLLCCWLGLLTAGYNFRRRVGHVIYWGGLLGMRRLHGRLEDGRGVGGRTMDRGWPGRHRRRRFGHLPIFCSLPRLPWAILLYRCPGPCYPFGDVRLGEEAETPEGGQRVRATKPPVWLPATPLLSLGGLMLLLERGDGSCGWQREAWLLTEGCRGVKAAGLGQEVGGVTWPLPAIGGRRGLPADCFGRGWVFGFARCGRERVGPCRGSRSESRSC